MFIGACLFACLYTLNVLMVQQLPVETVNAVDTEQQAELTVMAAETVDTVQHPEPTAPAVKAVEAVGQTEPAVDTANAVDTVGQGADNTAVVLQAGYKSTRLLRSAARLIGNAPTPRTKLLQRLQGKQLVDLGKSKPKLSVSGDPDPTKLTLKPMNSWTIGRGAKPISSPNHTNTLEAPTRRAPSYSQQLARLKNEALSLRDNSLKKGPVLDSGAMGFEVSLVGSGSPDTGSLVLDCFKSACCLPCSLCSSLVLDVGALPINLAALRRSLVLL